MPRRGSRAACRPSPKTCATAVRPCSSPCPRVWEKLQEAVTAKLDDTHGLKRFARRPLRRSGRARRRRRRSPPATRRFGRSCRTTRSMPRSARKIRHEIGLDQARVLISAAAPIHPDLIRWFHAIGLPVIELYGQTETCGPTTCNPPERQPDRHRRPADSRRAGAHRRRRRDPGPGRQRLHGLLPRPGGHRRADRRRRLDALRRRRPPRRRRLPDGHRSQEGSHHHRRTARTSRRRRSRRICAITSSSPRRS